MSRLGRLLGFVTALVGLLAGFVAAHAAALDLPPVTTALPPVTSVLPPVTTAVPPVTTALPPVTTALPPVTTAVPPPPVTPPPVTPKPPVTVPTPPRVTTPATPRPVAPPIVTSPTPAVPVPSAPSAPSGPSTGTARGSGGSAGPATSAAARSGSARSARPAAAKRTNRLEATRLRSKNRVTVRLKFKLPGAKRLFLIVRGPAPSCNVVGVIPLRGRKGVNKVSFAGRANGRNLRPGGYLLSLSSVRRPSGNAPATFVQVISKRRSVPAKAGMRRPTCTDAQALAQAFAAVPAFRFLRDGDVVAAKPAAQPPSNRRAALVSAPPPNSDDQHDVLGAVIPGPGFDSGAGSDALQALIMIAILTIIGAILLTTVALVTRFLRGSWNP